MHACMLGNEMIRERERGREWGMGWWVGEWRKSEECVCVYMDGWMDGWGLYCDY